MNEVNLPAIEPVTDDDLRAAVKAGEIVVAPFLQRALEQDRRRVAERQAPEIERLRAEVAALKSEVEMFREELKRRCDEVAALKAAQANMIDATGAVEAVAEACEWSNDPIRSRPTKARVMQGVPDEWAGSRVLIVRKP